MGTKEFALHVKMAMALVIGVIGGLLFHDSYYIWGEMINGIGQLFLHAINMIVIPLILLSTVLSISTINGNGKIGRMAAKTSLYFVVSAAVAALIALSVADILKPGFRAICPKIADAEVVIAKAEKMASAANNDWLMNVVPANIFKAFVDGDMLAIIFFSLMLGYFINKMTTERRENINQLFADFLDVIIRMTTFIIKILPIGVFAIAMTVVGKNANEVSRLFINIAFFVFVVWIALIIMSWGLFSSVGLIGKIRPLNHLHRIRSGLMIAFVTCSSYSALPLLMKDAMKKVGMSDSVTSFTMPLGVTFNKVGTIIYECVAVIFVAQASNIELSAFQQLVLTGISVVAVLGAPAVPMAGVLVLAIPLKAMGLELDFIPVFMAVDILCDMPKTMLNAYSVSCGAVLVARSEGEELR